MKYENSQPADRLDGYKQKPATQIRHARLALLVSAIIGSVAAALYAGTKDAMNEAESNAREARTNVAGSFGANPNSSALARRVVKIAARIPTPAPA